MRAGEPLFGLFLDSASPLIAEQLAHLDYDFLMVRGAPRPPRPPPPLLPRARRLHPCTHLLPPAPTCRRSAAFQVDLQHAPTNYACMAAMLTAVNAAGGQQALVRVEGPHDRGGMQQALDLGAAGILVPTINTGASPSGVRGGGVACP